MLVLQIATAEFMILYRGSCTVGRVARAVAQRNAWLPVLDGAFGATVLSWSAVTFVLRPAKDASRAFVRSSIVFRGVALSVISSCYRRMNPSCPVLYRVHI